MTPETAFATPVMETTPGAAYAPELAGIEAATEYSEFMAAQAQVLGILFSHYVRAEQGSTFSTQLEQAMIGTAVVNELVSTYHPGAIAAELSRVSASLHTPEDDKIEDGDDYSGAQ
jgi:hypothetical protein